MFERQSSGGVLNPGEKILHLEEASVLRNKLRVEGKKVVFTNGCFDLVHGGHVAYLLASRGKGDFLMVGINSDDSIFRIKGKNRPIVPLDQRSLVIASFVFVDAVIPFSQDTPIKVIERLQPDVLVKGADWKEEEIVGADLVRSRGGDVVTIPLVEGLSTSKMIDKIIKSHFDS